MRKVKIFTSCVSNDLEQKVNDFLKENIGIQILTIMQSINRVEIIFTIVYEI